MALQPYSVTTYTGGTQFSNLLSQIASQEEEARSANIKRQSQIEAIFDEIIARYGPEGTYGAASEALLERQKVRDVGAVKQTDISSGLYGIRPYEQEWEAAVGAEARLRLEDIKMERLSQAQLGKAQFLTGIEEEYPDYSMIAQLAAQYGQMPTGTYSTPTGTATSSEFGSEALAAERAAGYGVGPGTTAPAAAAGTGGVYGLSTAPAVEFETPSYGATTGANAVEERFLKAQAAYRAWESTTTGEARFSETGRKLAAEYQSAHAAYQSLQK